MKSKEIILGYQKRTAKPFAELVTLLLGGVWAIHLVGAIIDVAPVRFYPAALRTPFGGNQEQDHGRVSLTQTTRDLLFWKQLDCYWHNVRVCVMRPKGAQQ
jgi:hypothetical protein